jgi:N-hydroxyarylamine O-acetyltransferase
MMLDIQAYLSRIQYHGPATPSSETLRRIHRAHMLTVPFENLDIWRGKKIILDEASFVRKIVVEKRGGFCYELNGAFSVLLRALGFNVTLLSARVPRADGSDGPEFDHLTLRVDLEESWLADVGFGDSSTEPLQLKMRVEQERDGRLYRIMEMEKESILRMQRLEQSGWKDQYLFTLQPRGMEEFAPMCHYHQTSPESHFTQKRVCSLATDDGRVTLSDLTLITTRNGNRQEAALGSEEEWRQALSKYFGMTL